MGAVYFYHLTDSPLETTLVMLLGKARGAGWRILVRGDDQAALERLDQVIWAGAVDEFLPHGLAGGLHDDDQPILLGTGIGSEGFDCVMSVGGSALTASEVGLASRCCVLFDGHDQAALEVARGQWKMLTDAGCEAQYWAQKDGKWTKKAESGSA